MDLRIYTDDNGVVTSKDKHTGGKGTLKGFNPLHDRALAYTNKRVGEINEEIADELEVMRDYFTGDELRANQIDCIFADDTDDVVYDLFPLCLSKGKLMEAKKLEDTAHKAMVDIAKYNTAKFLGLYQVSTVNIQGKTYEIYYDKEHYSTQQKLKKDVDNRQSFIYNSYSPQGGWKSSTNPNGIELKDWCMQNRDKEGVKERGQAWSHYIAHSNLVFSLQRPWATTTHKAQGKEFATVYIDQQNMKKSIRQGYYMDYARLMYVALSRAKAKVVII